MHIKEYIYVFNTSVDKRKYDFFRLSVPCLISHWFIP